MSSLQRVLVLLPVFSSYVIPAPLPSDPLILEEIDADVFGVRTLRSLGVDTCVGVYLCWGVSMPEHASVGQRTTCRFSPSYDFSQIE